MLPCVYVAVHTLSTLYGINGDVSEVARQGSGSACRSMYGGFVEWLQGREESGSDSIAQQVAPLEHWPQLRVLILVVGGHQSCGTIKKNVDEENIMKVFHDC